VLVLPPFWLGVTQVGESPKKVGVFTPRPFSVPLVSCLGSGGYFFQVFFIFTFLSPPFFIMMVRGLRREYAWREDFFEQRPALAA